MSTRNGIGFVLVVSLLALPAEFSAQERPREGGAGRPQDREPPPMLARLLERIPLIAALDANGDGELSADEIQNAAAALKKLDTNGDGKLSRDEWLPRLPIDLPDLRPGDIAPRGLGAAFIERVFEAADRNGDGKLSRDELPERIRSLLQSRGGDLFERADTNKDGALDRQELNNLLERLPRPGARGGERPSGDRPAGERPRTERPSDRPPQNAP